MSVTVMVSPLRIPETLALIGLFSPRFLVHAGLVLSVSAARALPTMSNFITCPPSVFSANTPVEVETGQLWVSAERFLWPLCGRPVSTDFLSAVLSVCDSVLALLDALAPPAQLPSTRMPCQD